MNNNNNLVALVGIFCLTGVALILGGHDEGYWALAAAGVITFIGL